MTWAVARTAICAVAVALLSAVVAGCMTQAQGDKLAREAQDREHRLEALEKGTKQERAQLHEEVQEAQKKVAELGEVLEKATQVVKRNSADAGYQVQQLQKKIAELEGQISDLANSIDQVKKQLDEQKTALDERITDFARRAGIDMPLDPSQIPADKDALFDAGRKAVQGDEQSKGRALLRVYLQRYPKDAKADDAQYLIGKSYLDQKKPATALGELRKVISNYPKGNMADEALMGMSEAFYQLHSCSDAKSALEALIRTYPHSHLVRQARKELRKVKRAPRSYCTN